MDVAIVGATGYSGIELIRILKQHPYAQLKSILTTSQEGKQIAEIYPHLTGIIHNQLQAFDSYTFEDEVELVFFATPSGVSKEYIPKLIEKGITCIDLSGDFRLKDSMLYEKWYKHAPADSSYLNDAVYGLSEAYPGEIKKAKLVANPGCYPTASLLAVLPLIKNEWVDPNSIIIDGKSGVSGAGKAVSLATHYAEVNENVKAYKLGTHQHIPEIEQIIAKEGGFDVNITFSTHLIPMTRGIMCTVYTNLIESKAVNEVIDLYRSFYTGHPFVRIRPDGQWPSTKEVYGSNFCDLGFSVDSRTGRLIIVSVIDNVMKGAAGQAVQNMNLIGNWEITAGLSFTPVYP